MANIFLIGFFLAFFSKTALTARTAYVLKVRSSLVFSSLRAVFSGDFSTTFMAVFVLPSA